MDFSENELAKIQKLVTTYQQTKALILYSEEIDPNFNSDIQPIKELRDAFDHIMAVFAHKIDGASPKAKGKNKSDVVSDNLEKALGHAYRAAFDALDGTVISLQEEIFAVIKDYPKDVLNKIIPDYYQMRGRLVNMKKRVGSMRGNKDISDRIASVFEAYIREVEDLKKTYEEVLSYASALDELHKDYKEEQSQIEKNNKKEHKIQSRIEIRAGIIGGLIVLGVTLLIDHFQTVTSWFNELITYGQAYLK